MTLNKVNLRLLTLVFAFSTSLSGCSSLPSLPGFSNPDAESIQAAETASGQTETLDQTNRIVDASGNVVDAVQVALELTPEELDEQALAFQARRLMDTVNAFKLDKQNQAKLNSSQLRKVQSAINQLANGEPAKALVEVQRVIDDPDFKASPNTVVWVLRGDIFLAKEENEKAISDYQAALKLVASNYQAHNRLGVMYRDAGKFDLAKAHYNQAVDAWPGNADSYRNRGILKDLYVGDKIAALADYKIYKALLDLQIQRTVSPARSVIEEQKLTSLWIVDIERQIEVLQRGRKNG
jgi:tetratricopeptide (TPR) repeat protein